METTFDKPLDDDIKALNGNLAKCVLQAKVTPSTAPYSAGVVTFDVPTGATSVLAIIPCAVNAGSNDNTLGVITNVNVSERKVTIRPIGTITQTYTVQAWIIYR